MIRRAIVLIALVVLAACGGHSPTSPDFPAYGKLSGTVTIGPNCPSDNPSNPCPPPPGAFSLRKVLVYDSLRTKVLYTVDIDSQGFYSIDLRPGDYTIDIQKAGLDSSTDVPVKVTINANVATTLNIRIDTGVR